MWCRHKILSFCKSRKKMNISLHVHKSYCLIAIMLCCAHTTECYLWDSGGSNRICWGLGDLCSSDCNALVSCVYRSFEGFLLKIFLTTEPEVHTHVLLYDVTHHYQHLVEEITNQSKTHLSLVPAWCGVGTETFHRTEVKHFTLLSRVVTITILLCKQRVSTQMRAVTHCCCTFSQYSAYQYDFIKSNLHQ